MKWAVYNILFLLVYPFLLPAGATRYPTPTIRTPVLPPSSGSTPSPSAKSRLPAS